MVMIRNFVLFSSVKKVARWLGFDNGRESGVVNALLFGGIEPKIVSIFVGAVSFCG